MRDDPYLTPDEEPVESETYSVEDLDEKTLDIRSPEVGTHTCPMKCSENDGKLVVQVFALPASVFPQARISGSCFITQEGIKAVEKAPHEELADFQLG